MVLPLEVQSGPDDEWAGWLDYAAFADDDGGADALPCDVAAAVVDGAAAAVVAVVEAVVVADVAENEWVNAHAGDEMLAREFPCGC